MSEAKFVWLGRVHRHVVDGEVARVDLELVRDEDVVEINEGGEFVTVGLEVDPFRLPS